MKKLSLILICLFVSFEVNSGKRLEYLDVKDCLKYLNKGKVLHKTEYKDLGYLTVNTIFSYKQKIYVHKLFFSLQGYQITESTCEVWDFDHNPFE